MGSHRSRSVLLGAALACWGCVHLGPPAPLIEARVPRALAGVAVREQPEADPAPELPAGWDVPAGREWRRVVLHHSATEVGGAERFDRVHRRDRGWEHGLGYHFVIGNGTDTPDGQIEVGPRWRRQLAGAHAGVTEHNEHGIGICLVGDFRAHAPSRRQLAALRALVAALGERHGIGPDAVVGHRDVRDGTQCPGACFPVSLALAP